MINAGSSVQSRPHCFSVYPLISFSYSSRPTRLMACSSRLQGSPRTSAFCFSIMAFASSGVEIPHILLNVFILKGMLYISPLKFATGLLV